MEIESVSKDSTKQLDLSLPTQYDFEEEIEEDDESNSWFNMSCKLPYYCDCITLMLWTK